MTPDLRRRLLRAGIGQIPTVEGLERLAAWETWGLTASEMEIEVNRRIRAADGKRGRR